MNSKTTSWIRRILYFIILCGLFFFILKQGSEPWFLMLKNWQSLLGIIIICILGIVVQANAFLICLPMNTQRPSYKHLIAIWAMSGVMSLLVPLIASLAVRSLFLQREGVSLKASTLATLRQTWFNCEYALIIAGMILIFYPQSQVPWLGHGLTLTWFGAWTSRRWILAYQWGWVRRYFPSLPLLSRPPIWPNSAWLWGQIVLMAANYWVAFTPMGGALLEWYECLLLASVTILASIIIFIPNGLGILDGMWMWVANHHGLTLAESVSLVLAMRLGYLVAATLLWVGMGFVLRSTRLSE